MINISISEEIREKCPHLRLGLISAKIFIQSENKELWDKILLETKIISDKYSELPKMETILSARAAYKTLGKDPSRYRPSAEALLRRIISGKELYSVNNVVNLINLISFTSGFSIGGYDADSINGEIRLEKGLASDHYEGLGRGQLNIENLPILRDLTAAFGCPTSDSERTGIRSETKNCLWVFFDFGGDIFLRDIMTKAEEHLKEFAAAENVQSYIIV
jgi:DNA/RNA-binding domain of Phe-tRNA-synthetase-like protein